MTAILLVDGNSAQRAVLCKSLESAEYRVIPCATLGEARTALRTQTIALAILDIDLPDGDGLEFLALIRRDAVLHELPVLLLASFDSLAIRTGGLRVSAADHVGAQVDPAKLVARVNELVRTAERPPRILFADDDADYAALIAAGLQKRGYVVETVGSGEELLARLEVGAVDCILCDRQMPGLGGIETCRTLKRQASTRDLPLVILTAAEDREAVIEGLGAGADDFVPKKAGLDVLAARIHAQIRLATNDAESRLVQDALLRSQLDAAEARAAQLVAETRADLAEQLAQTNAELVQANRELEAFSYAVSHDLRAPLRTISALTRTLAAELAPVLDDSTREHIRRVLATSAHMADVIDALLELARASTTPVARQRVDLSALAKVVATEIAVRHPARTFEIQPGLVASADARLVRILLENLFTAGDQIAFRAEGAAFCIDAAGSAADPDQDLAGIGKATVRRIIERHGGEVSFAGAPRPRISFTLPA